MKINKIFIILIIFIISIYVFTNYTYALTIDSIIEGADNFLDIGGGQTQIDIAEMQEMKDILYNILLGVGMVIAVIIGVVLGIKFMVSGSEEKAKVKETLIVYALGCVVIFSAFGIWKIVINVIT